MEDPDVTTELHIFCDWHRIFSQRYRIFLA
jgi:hypothetical protein